jgi:flagellum-specific ATP synthase
MSRRIADRGRYPAIDVLKSVSRTLPGAHTPEQNVLRNEAKSALSTYGDMEEMIRLGAYKEGSREEVDRAIHLAPAIENLLKQGKSDQGHADESFAALEAILAPEPQGDA